MGNAALRSKTLAERFADAGKSVIESAGKSAAHVANAAHASQHADKLVRLLQTPPWYSYSIKWLMLELGVEERQLRYLVDLARSRGQTINVFSFHDVEYVGLESRRLDYERDKVLGVNHVEQLIALGEYG